jgi:putative transposase
MSSSIKLRKSELTYLDSYKISGRLSLREYSRLNILLLLHKGKKVNEIADFLNVDRITVWRTKNRYLKYGAEKALEEEKRPGQPVKYATDHQAELAALACGPRPGGRRRWTIRLLTEELKKKPGFETINRESVRVALKKMNVSLG